MGFRFRKSIKLFPGVRLNLSKSGVSTSIGPRGATVNIKPGRDAKLTVGVPGTGVSYSESLSAEPGQQPSRLWIWLLVVCMIAYGAWLMLR